jgi:2-amino-4-hydroxy-6-hydroxymethyldihydropteridine diphosphokinase
VEPVVAYIAFGSNLGDRALNLRAAADDLDRSPGVAIRRLSSLFETEPVGGPPQGPFLNAAAEVATGLPARGLLELLVSIERRHGRVRGVRWGPRTLDLDLLLYGHLVCKENGLTLPHPRMHERLFVLDPLCEVAPEAFHPVLHKTIRELRDELLRK